MLVNLAVTKKIFCNSIESFNKVKTLNRLKMKKLTYSLPAFLWILLIFVSCNKEQVGTLQQADITALRGWLHANGGSYKNETIMVQATGKPVYGKLDWDASRQYLWQGNTYIDVPFVFEKGNRYLTVQQAPPTTFNLVVRKTRNNQFEGAIRTTTYTRGEAENLSKGRREAGLVVQSYQWLNGQDANIWVGQENERQARAGKRLQLSATEIAALRAEAKNGGSDSAAGTLSRTVLQQQVCDVMVYTSYRTVCWYPTASDEAAMNATCMSVPVSSSVGYCYDMPGGSGGFPPYLLTWTEGGGGGGGPLPEPPNDILPESEACEPMSSEMIAEDMNFENEINKPIYPKQALPSWAKVLEGYPKIKYSDGSYGELSAAEVYKQIGGALGDMAKNNPVAFNDACAARLSMALLNAGINIPGIEGYTYKGANGKYYFVSAEKFYDFITQTFEGNCFTMYGYGSSISPAAFQSFTNSKHGLFILKPSYPKLFEATGHSTLYTGTRCIGGNQGCHFSAKGGVDRIVFVRLF